MNPFSNHEIKETDLPLIEAVSFNKLQAKYLFIIIINCFAFCGALFIAVFLALKYTDLSELSGKIHLLIGLGLFFISSIIVVYYILAFKKRGYVFREHDVMITGGLLSKYIDIIPYNRIQHVAIHKGYFSNLFGLGSIEIFTAGGSGSDIEISGLLFENCEKYKQLILLKIQNEEKKVLIDVENFENE